MRRLSIIRRVNEVIMRVAEKEDNSGEDSDSDHSLKTAISFKKIVKILNLMQIYIPLVHIKPNNSTHFSLDI